MNWYEQNRCEMFDLQSYLFDIYTKWTAIHDVPHCVYNVFDSKSTFSVFYKSGELISPGFFVFWGVGWVSGEVASGEIIYPMCFILEFLFAVKCNISDSC